MGPGQFNKIGSYHFKTAVFILQGYAGFFFSWGKTIIIYQPGNIPDLAAALYVAEKLYIVLIGDFRYYIDYAGCNQPITKITYNDCVNAFNRFIEFLYNIFFHFFIEMFILKA